MSALDHVAQAIEQPRYRPPRRGGARRNDNLDPAPLQPSDQAIAVVGAVGDHTPQRQVVEQEPDLGQFVPLPWCERDPHGPPERVGHEVDLGAQAAARACNGLACTPLLAPAACWWARTIVVSTTVHSESGSEASAANARSQTPARAQRRKRSDRSRQRAPLRAWSVHRLDKEPMIAPAAARVGGLARQERRQPRPRLIVQFASALIRHAVPQRRTDLEANA